MATFNNGESLASVRTKINDAIDKIDGNATISNDISVGGNITVTGTVDGRDVATDGTKLDGIEASATADQTGAEIKALYEAEADTNAFTDAEQTKLSGIEASADVTDTANVTAAGALMDSELTSEASVKALDQGVATTDSPTFAGLTTTADVSFGDNDKAIFGAGSDLQIYHDGSRSIIQDNGTGNLRIQANNLELNNADNSENYLFAANNGAVKLYYDNATKLATTSTGVDITGTLTSDGLTVDASGIHFKSDDNVQATDILRVSSNNNAVALSFGYDTIRGTSINLNTNSSNRLNVANNGDISFYEDTGTTAKLTWSAADEELQLASGVALELNGWTITESGGSLYFATGGTNKMKLDASGNLDVVGSVNANATIS